MLGKLSPTAQSLGCKGQGSGPGMELFISKPWNFRILRPQKTPQLRLVLLSSSTTHHTLYQGRNIHIHIYIYVYTHIDTHRYIYIYIYEAKTVLPLKKVISALHVCKCQMLRRPQEPANADQL